MRKMKLPWDDQVNIVEHIMTQGFWEFYVTDMRHDENTVCCYVLGHANELGDVDLREIEPLIISRTKNLADVMAAPNCEWMD